jgi:RHS repeat-associated protein
MYTRVTELVIPGPGDYELSIGRRYDTATAKNDAAYFSEPKLMPYLRNQGDFAYSMGKGWRLELPYIKNANREMFVCLPNGELYSLWNMILSQSGSGNDRVLALRSRDGEKFSLRVTQHRETVRIRFGASFEDVKIWRSTGYLLTMKSGRTYELDAEGRTTKIVDPSGIHETIITYTPDAPRIERIQDRWGRKITFSYSDVEGLHYISGMTVNDDPMGRGVQYYQNGDGTLASSTDAGGRGWSYTYATLSEAGPLRPVPFDLYRTIQGLGYFNYEKLIEGLTEPRKDDISHTMRLLGGMNGPGKGIIRVEYDVYVKGGENFDSRRWVLPMQVTTYAMGSDVESANPLRIVSYAYEFGESVKGDPTVTPPMKEGFISFVREYDGIRRTSYAFEALNRSMQRWHTDDEDRIRTEAGEDTWKILTRLKRVTRADLTQDKDLESRSYGYVGYDMSWLVANIRGLLANFGHEYWKSNSFLPTEITVSRGTNGKTVTYEYDAWDNPVSRTENETAGGRTNGLAARTRYLAPGTPPPAADADWKAYPAGFAVPPTLAQERKNLPLGEIREIGVPLDPSGNPADTPATTRKEHHYHEYDTRGRRTATARWDEGQGKWLVTRFAYEDTYGNLTSKVLPTDHRTEYTYDANGYPSGKTEKHVSLGFDDAAELVTSYVYDAATGWKNSETNPRSHRVDYTYDKLGRVTRIERPKESDESSRPTISVEYGDGPGNLYAIVTGPLPDRRTDYYFDDLGLLTRLVKTAEPVSETKLTYNRWGEISGVTDPNGNTTNYTYDAMGRRSAIIFPDENEAPADNPRRSMEFDYETNILTILDERGNRREELHDMAGRVLRETRHNGSETLTVTAYYDGAGNTAAVTGPRAGETTVNMYDGLSRLAEIWFPQEIFRENGTALSARPKVFYAYDDAGYRIRENAEAPGNEKRIVEYAVNGLGWVTETRRKNLASGTETLLARELRGYDGNGNVTAKADANNADLPADERKKRTYEYTVRDKLAQETDEGGNATTYAYNLDDSLAGFTDPRGTSGRYPEEFFSGSLRYDKLGRLTEADLPPKDGSGERAVVSFTYDPRGNMTKKTAPDGGTVEYVYTPRNRVKTETETGGGKSYTTSYAYDDAGNLTEVTDRRGKKTRFTYDELNRLTEMKKPAGNTEGYEYDKAGNRKALIDGKGKRTEYAYDLYNRLETVTAPGDGGTHTLSYDRLGNLTWEKNAIDEARSYGYDKLERLVREEDALGNVRTFTYDLAGNLTGSIDPRGTAGTYHYTETNLLISAAYANAAEGRSESVSYRYDEAGIMTYAADGGTESRYNDYDPGNAASYKPDAYGRITAEATKIGAKTLTARYGYDKGDRVRSITYPTGREVAYGYNPLGELTGMAGYLTGSPSYEGGLLTGYTAANGVNLTRSHDDNGRLTNLSYTGISGTIKDYAYEYDLNDNLTRKNGDEYVYDERNRLVAAYLSGKFGVNADEEEQRIGAVRDDHFGMKNLEMNLEEVVEDVSLIELDYASGSIGVDLEGEYEVTRIVLTPLAPENRVTAEAVRVFTSATNYPNEWEENTEAEKRYVTVGGVKKLLIGFPEGTIARYVKVKTNWDERDKSFKPVNKAEFRNAPEELIRVYYSAARRDELYRYDKLGNRTRLEVRMSGSEVREYRYYSDSSLLMTDGKWAYGYDRNGNLTRKGDTVLVSGVATPVKDIAPAYWAAVTNPWTGLTFAETGTQRRYAYDMRNRMIEAKKNGEVTATYTYTAGGLKVKKERAEAEDNPASTIWYAYTLGGRLLYEEEKEASAATSVYSETVYAFGRHFALEEGTLDAGGTPSPSERHYLHTDHLGSVVAATDASGAVVWTNEYTPFGSSAEEEKRKDKYARFTGKGYDEEAGLYYFNARWYDAETGRFTTEDPIRDGWAWYAYAAGNPMRYTDPSGLRNETAYLDSILGSESGPFGAGPALFGQHDWADTFGPSFAASACAVTSIVNELSEEYTAQTGERLTKDQAEDMIQAAVDAKTVGAAGEPITTVNENDANVNDWSGAAQAMWGTTGLGGAWTAQHSTQPGGEHTIGAVDKNKDPEFAEHFVSSYSMKGNPTYYDPYDETVGLFGDLSLADMGYRNLEYTPPDTQGGVPDANGYSDYSSNYSMEGDGWGGS